MKFIFIYVLLLINFKLTFGECITDDKKFKELNEYLKKEGVLISPENKEKMNNQSNHFSEEIKEKNLNNLLNYYIKKFFLNKVDINGRLHSIHDYMKIKIDIIQNVHPYTKVKCFENTENKYIVYLFKGEVHPFDVHDLIYKNYKKKIQFYLDITRYFYNLSLNNLDLVILRFIDIYYEKNKRNKYNGNITFLELSIVQNRGFEQPISLKYLFHPDSKNIDSNLDKGKTNINTTYLVLLKCIVEIELLIENHFSDHKNKYFKKQDNFKLKQLREFLYSTYNNINRISIEQFIKELEVFKELFNKKKRRNSSLSDSNSSLSESEYQLK